MAQLTNSMRNRFEVAVRSGSYVSLLLLALSISTLSAAAAGAAGKKLAPGVTQVGVIQPPKLKECSGVVASAKYPGTLWTHTDGGGHKQELLFAINQQGAAINQFALVGVALTDWEDLATDNAGHLYIADTGNNTSSRTTVFVHRLDEPNPTNMTGSASINASWQLSFPGKPFDSEALFIWQENAYLISKVVNDRMAELYRFPLNASATRVVLQRVATLPISSPVTGAAISPDGKILGVVCKAGAFAFDVGGDPARTAAVAPTRTKFKHDGIEGCTFVPEGLLVTAESREIFIFTEPQFRSGR